MVTSLMIGSLIAGAVSCSTGDDDGDEVAQTTATTSLTTSPTTSTSRPTTSTSATTPTSPSTSTTTATTTAPVTPDRRLLGIDPCSVFTAADVSTITGIERQYEGHATAGEPVCSWVALTDDTRGGRLTVRWHPTTRHVDVESSSAMPGANVRRRPFQAGGRRGQRVNVTARALPPGEWTPPYEWEHDLAECSIRLAVSPTSTAEVTVEFSPAGSGPQASPALACEYAERAATILAPKLP